ncbi:MAG: glucose 1-dehydrogenase [Deltaproteobacteria bacterium]|nr:MAG: glucose 1-dehydrogenase [Deltaproteobacteria bacterium]TMB33808.1 MAG: glucose 1-dehydrogenase [Deltaproteobacteria bacterium]
MTRMQGKAAIVTGAASGIGRATAILFAREGARVLLTDLDPAGEAVADSIRGEGGEVHFLRHDVSDEASWTTAIRRALEAFGRLDVLVNNAGISFAKPLGETTLAEWRQLMAVNLDGVFLGTREAVRAMRGSGGGAIINVSSASGLVGSPTASAYCASKGGVRLFTKAVALEVAGDGIRVNSIHPGGVRTPIWAKADFWPGLVAQSGSEDAAFQALAGAAPLGRLAEPEEIAEAILYLASDASKFMTGSELVIDGGYTAR